MRYAISISLLAVLGLKCHGAAIVFYGDLMLSRGIEKFVEYKGKQPVQEAVSVFLPQGAVNVANLEGCMTSNNCSGSDKPLCFRFQPSLMDLLIGFKVISLQNNHSFDAGPVALNKTARKLESLNIVALAGKKGSTIIKTDHGNVGIIAATDMFSDNTAFSSMVIADSPELLDEIRALNKICSAVVTYVHWGRELLPITTDRMRKLATDYVEAGADVVVGTHPHVVGPVTTIEGRPVIYSLGNFLFDQKYPVTKTGALLSCEIGDDGMLRSRLSACKTALNSFLPQPVGSTFFVDENRSLSSCVRPVRRTWTGIFTDDGSDKCLVLRADEKKKGFWQMSLHNRETMMIEAQTPSMPIRKLQPIDLNNDGIEEVMLIQSIYSKFDKETAKRVHIYSFRNGFHALWRGTALSRPLIDAVFTKNGDSVYLVALHSSDSFLLRDKVCSGRIVTLYKWNGFGFSGVKDIRMEDGCDAASLISDGIRVSANGITKRIIRDNEIAGQNVLSKQDACSGNTEVD